MAVKAPKAPPVPKPPGPSSVAPGSRGPKRIKIEKDQPDLDDFKASAWKKRNPQGTLPEYLVYYVLTTKMKLKPGVHFLEQFDLQKEIVGGLGAIIDVVMIDRTPFLALPVMGNFWHPAFGKKLTYDLAQFQRVMVAKAWNLIPLDEDDLLRDANYTVRAAVVNGIDLSRYRGKY